jgi:hypothetical protein
MKRERDKLSRHNEAARAMGYILHAQAYRCLHAGRWSWLFVGSDRGGERAAVMLTLIQSAKLNDVDPQAWLADVLGRINDHAIHRLDQLLPWNWKTQPARLAAMMSPTRQKAPSDSFNEIATVRIELRHTDPLIWRQVEVPTSITLKVLHDIIQAVIGWFDYHLWEFTIVKQKYGLPMDDDWETEPRRLGCLTAAN